MKIKNHLISIHPKTHLLSLCFFKKFQAIVCDSLKCYKFEIKLALSANSQPVAAAWSFKTELKLKKKKRVEVIFLIMEKLQCVYGKPKSERYIEKEDRQPTTPRLLWCEQYCACIMLLLFFFFFFCNNEDTRYSSSYKLACCYGKCKNYHWLSDVLLPGEVWFNWASFESDGLQNNC